MYSTQVYIYQQLTRVLLIDTGAGETFTYRYDPVYAKQLTINKGVDNVLLFEFINQEEKPVNITGSTFLFRAINTQGDQILVEKPLVTLNAVTGRAKVTLTSTELLEVLAQPATYSIQRTQPGGLTEAVFTNAQAGARAPVTIVDSVLPQYVPSAPLTIPTTKLSAEVSYDGATWGQYPSSPYWAGGNPNGANYYNSFLNTEFFSSFIEPVNAVTTVQMTLDGYTGTIKAQAAENYQSIFYNVTESTTYLNKTGTIYMNIVGWYPLLRMCFNNSIFAVPDQPGTPAIAYATTENGVVTSISVTEGGSGYLAPPKVNIIGTGAGAAATAQITGGVVTGITVTNGGSGYWYLPNAGQGPGIFPNNPNQTGAAVIISTGYVVDLLYR
jgi:hypothetical protein